MSLETNLTDVFTRIGTEVKLLKTYISGTGTGDVSGLNTTATNLVAAINEVLAASPAGSLLATNNLSDVANTATALSNLGGLNQSEIDARVQLVVDSAPAALDTLNELAAALGDDANFSATMTTALSNRVAVDAAQSFNTTQQQQARDNISVYSTTEIGSVTTNFVTTFEGALT